MHHDLRRGRGTGRVRGALSAFSSSEHVATEAVVAYVDGELSMTAYQRAAAHVSSCAECAADVDAQERMRSALRSAAVLTMPVSLRGLLCRIPESRADRAEDPAAGVALSGAFRPGAVVETAEGRFVAILKPPVLEQAAPKPAVHERVRRPFALSVLTVTALAVGALAVSAAAAAPAGPGAEPLTRAAAPAQRGAAVLPASAAPHSQLASFGVMFPGASGAVGVTAPEERATGMAEIESAQLGPAQTRTSP
ncbi:MAG: anti-sigma factor family protein [Mycobacteriaceae bacterium]